MTTDQTAEGLRYFGRFGVDTSLIRDTLAAALGRGGDFADLFFQHKVMHSLGLEDGAVNRAFASVYVFAGSAAILLWSLAGRRGAPRRG